MLQEEIKNIDLPSLVLPALSGNVVPSLSLSMSNITGESRVSYRRFAMGIKCWSQFWSKIKRRGEKEIQTKEIKAHVSFKFVVRKTELGFMLFETESLRINSDILWVFFKVWEANKIRITQSQSWHEKTGERKICEICRNFWIWSVTDDVN